MSTELSEEGPLFVDVVRNQANKEGPKDWSPQLEQRKHVFSHEPWDELMIFGAHGIGFSEEYGGQDGSIINHAQ